MQTNKLFGGSMLAITMAAFPAGAMAQSDVQTGVRPDSSTSENATAATRPLPDSETTTVAPATSSASNAIAPGEDIVVVGLKRSTGVSVQRAPLTISAFGEEQLARVHLRDIGELQRLIPNVYFSSNSSMPGTNNLSIRGMAVYGSQPGTTPTVGVFIDEIYLGSVVGTVFSTFDLGGVEVLRGPQGLLFGRNVTAGAILVRTSDPSDTPTISAKVSLETGPEYKGSLVVSGPIADWLTAKVAIYRDKDEGFFKNEARGNEAAGRSDTKIERLAFTLFPGDDFSSTLKLEKGNLTGDGVVGQNQVVFGRGKNFRVAYDTPGIGASDWEQAILRTRLKIGNGELVNITGVRTFDQIGATDIDATPFANLTLQSFNEYRQFSTELRYSGSFGPVDLTVGGYYFDDDLFTISGRVLNLGTRHITGGAHQESNTYAFFGNADVHLGSTVTLTGGARFSKEAKNTQVQTELADNVSPCSFVASACRSFDFTDKSSWKAFTPKLGVQWTPDSETNIYGYYTKGFRSGGYNLRRTSIIANPGPFKQEVEDTFEIGAKRYFDNRRFNARVSVFQNNYKDLQRDVLTPDPVFGTITLSGNAGDVRIRGFEFEGTANVTHSLTIGGNVGYLDDKFTDVRFDLSGNRSIGPEDFNLKLPFLTPWTYGGYVDFTTSTGGGELAARLQYTHRDSGFGNDANTGRLASVHDLGANISFSPSGLKGATISLYGKNLLNQPTWAYANPVTYPQGATTITPLNEGRVIGIELGFHI